MGARGAGEKARRSQIVIPAKRTFQKFVYAGCFLRCVSIFRIRRRVCWFFGLFAAIHCTAPRFDLRSAMSPFPIGCYPIAGSPLVRGCQCPVRSNRLCVICLQSASLWAPRVPQVRHRRQDSACTIRANAPSAVILRARMQRRPMGEDTRWATVSKTSE